MSQVRILSARLDHPSRGCGTRGVDSRKGSAAIRLRTPSCDRGAVQTLRSAELQRRPVPSDAFGVSPFPPTRCFGGRPQPLSRRRHLLHRPFSIVVTDLNVLLPSRDGFVTSAPVTLGASRDDAGNRGRHADSAYQNLLRQCRRPNRLYLSTPGFLTSAKVPARSADECRFVGVRSLNREPLG